MANANFDGNWGDLMTIEEWEECCENGLFIDYDGFGHFCNDAEGTILEDLDVYPSMMFSVLYNEHRPQWTHILWFNR